MTTEHNIPTIDESCAMDHIDDDELLGLEDLLVWTYSDEYVDESATFVGECCSMCDNIIETPQYGEFCSAHCGETAARLLMGGQEE